MRIARRFSFRIVAVSISAMLAALVSPAADWPMWGRDASHNAVSPEKDAPVDFRLESIDDRKVKSQGWRGAWKVKLDTRMVIPPVVADGLVWICTHAADPNIDDKIVQNDWDGGVLMCVRESDGKFLWKQRTPRLTGQTVGWFEDFSRAALGSCPLVEGDNLWYVNNRNEVVCLDIGPLKRGTGVPRELWKLDMRKDLGVVPHLPLMQGGFAASVAGYKDKLYVTTHNGVDDGHINVPAPDAPSLVCLEKATGKVIWKDKSPGKNILAYQISSPLVAEIKDKVQVIVGQGDGWLRSFDPATGKLFWSCDLNAKDAVFDISGRGTRNYIVATPVLYDERIYIATGQDIEHGPGPAALYCIDPTKTGDVSRELEAGPMKGKPNPNSAVVWYTPPTVPDDAPRIQVGPKKQDLLRDRMEYYYGRTIASVTVFDGLVYAVTVEGYLYCFDAKSGKLYWIDDLKTSVRGQPLWADNKLYLGTEDGDIVVFAHGKEKKRLATIKGDEIIYTGLVFANRTLYVTTDNTLYAVRNPK